MAIQIQTVGATDLRLGAAIIKANYAAGRTIGGQPGRVMGHSRALMVRIPATGFTASASYAILGNDGGNAGNFNAASDTVLRIGGTGAGILALRPSVRYRNGSTNAYAGTNEAEGQYTALPAMGVAPLRFLLIEGVRNTGTNASPVWRGWAAICQIDTNGVASALAPTAIASAWASGTAGTLMRQVFSAVGGTPRTPAGVAIEQVALIAGDFPWDTANNRPHHDAIAALAGGGTNPFHTYATLVAAQNAGTLPYANCDQGLGNLDYHWTLRTLAAGLTNSGSAGTATLAINPVVNSSGLIDTGDIAPAHWYGGAPSITEPTVKFTGGRGTRATVAGGTYQAGTTAMQRRWINMATSAVVRDWAAVTSFGSGAWSVSDVLPVGRYRLEVRDTNDAARTSASEDWLVGTVIVTHGQSGMERAFMGVGAPPGTNELGISVTSGAQGLLLKLNNQDAGAGTYVQPQPIVARMRSGETPALGHGAVLMLNAWNSHNPGEPLLICNMAINGTGMAEWADNGTVNGSDTSWRFMGDIGASAGPASGNNSGVVESYAALLGRYVDAHMMMWTPGMIATATGPGSRELYMTGIDARFSNAASAPMVVLPPWRGHREPPDVSSTVAKRQESLDFMAQLGARGILGPYWADVVSDSSGGLHSAFGSAPGVPSGSQPVSDGNQVGQARLGIGLGWVAAWAFNRTIKAHGPRVVAAWFTDANRTSIQIELGRQVRTLNGAAISNQFWISTDNGANFGNTGFTVALSADGTRAILTTTGSAFPASNVRVDYARNWPFGPTETPNEASTERLLDGQLYDGLTYRGGTNFAAGVRPGNPLQGTNRTGAGLAGVPVAPRGAAKLVATERFTGTRNVTVRMLAADGVTVLRETTLPIVAS